MAGFESDLTGLGKINVEQPSNSTGANVIVPIPNGEIWLVQSVEFNVSTEATAGNRTIQLIFRQDNLQVLRLRHFSIQTPSQSFAYEYAIGVKSFAVPSGSTQADTNQLNTLPLFYFDGDFNAQLQIAISNIKPLDQITTIRICYRKWVK